MSLVSSHSTFYDTNYYWFMRKHSPLSFSQFPDKKISNGHVLQESVECLAVLLECWLIITYNPLLYFHSRTLVS